MPESTSYEFSTVMVSGIKRALVEHGWFDAVKAELSSTARATLDAAEESKFHPGPALDEVSEVLARLHGLDAVTRLFRTVTARSMESVVAPLARVYLALKGDSPEVLLARFDSLLQVAARGLRASWVAQSTRAGTLTLVYPSPRALAASSAWRGTLLHLLDFCEVSGEVEVLEPGEGGRAVRLRVQWD